MKPEAFISSITFSDNTTVSLTKNQILVLVGPNNSGKSAALREIDYLIEAEKVTKVIKELEIYKEGNEVQLKEYLVTNSKITEGIPRTFSGYRFGISESRIGRDWESKKLGSLKNLFFNYLNTQVRLQDSNPPQAINIIQAQAQHPIHLLQKYDTLEYKFSDYFRKAFNTEIIVHRNAGLEVPLYVGQRPIVKEGQDRVSNDYLVELEKLDLLHLQGDGMRSFTSVLLNVFMDQFSIILIDEPEVFLHPPQARILGKILANDLPNDKQIIIATHSTDLITGLLTSNDNRLKIARIEREDNVNNISVLQNNEVKEVWGDPLIRYSNIIDGVFHSLVIICEGDADCRFYSAVLDVIEEDIDKHYDVKFLHCGGKERIKTVCKALNSLHVPTKVIVDFDVLNNEITLKDIFEAQGGTWNDIKDNYKIVYDSIKDKGPEKDSDAIKRELIEVIDIVPPSNLSFPSEQIKQIKKIISTASAWNKAKTIGKSYIPSGNATQAFNQLNSDLEDKSIFIVPIGEVECFCKSVGNHGPKWVNEVLKKDIKNDQEFLVAKEFMKNVVSH